eukprot:4057004-Amphidinium_carterae.2
MAMALLPCRRPWASPTSSISGPTPIPAPRDPSSCAKLRGTTQHMLFWLLCQSMCARRKFVSDERFSQHVGFISSGGDIYCGWFTLAEAQAPPPFHDTPYESVRMGGCKCARRGRWRCPDVRASHIRRLLPPGTIGMFLALAGLLRSCTEVASSTLKRLSRLERTQWRAVSASHPRRESHSSHVEVVLPTLCPERCDGGPMEYAQARSSLCLRRDILSQCEINRKAEVSHQCSVLMQGNALKTLKVLSQNFSGCNMDLDSLLLAVGRKAFPQDAGV